MANSTLPEEPRLRSRRAMLAGGAAAVAAVVVADVARARPAHAEDHDPVTVGDTVTGTGPTVVESSVAQENVFTGRATGDGSVGVAGVTDVTTGVPAGVAGLANGTSGHNFGVFGWSRSIEGVGVSGRAIAPTGSGIGVSGIAKAPDGIGVYAEGAAGDGVALRTFGRVVFSTSGIATIAKNAKQVLVDPGIPVMASTKIFCSLHTHPGGTTTIQWIQRNTKANTFTIVLTGKAVRATRVAWFAAS
ncbi:MAG TPA: hypothetical protein VGB19_04720 [Actinomycetota bacterium]